jgi:hypothetical protein
MLTNLGKEVAELREEERVTMRTPLVEYVEGDDDESEELDDSDDDDAETGEESDGSDLDPEDIFADEDSSEA